VGRFEFLVIRTRVQTTLKNLPAKAKMMKEVKALKGSSVVVGVLATAEPYPNGATVAQVAFWNEFGAAHSGFGHTPERSFFRSTFNEQKAALQSLRIKLLNRILSGEFTAFKALDNIGWFYRDKIQAKIRSDIPPPNSPYTLALKKHAGVAPTTLIMTGHMLRSMEYQVRMADGLTVTGPKPP
jgi:hypothetical protein